MALLEVEGLETGYERLQVLWGVGLEAQEGESVLLLGANGAGKTTLLKAIPGLLPAWKGRVRFNGEDITRLRPDQRVGRGIAYMSELGVFPDLSIEENLRLGGYRLGRAALREREEELFALFPDLRKKRRALAGSLSGGQRKMLGVAKALIGRPRLMVMDEPSAGLSPRFVKEVAGTLAGFHQQGLTLLIAEQNVAFLRLAERGYVLDGGRVRYNGTVAELEANDAVRRAYLGIEGTA